MNWKEKNKYIIKIKLNNKNANEYKDQYIIIIIESKLNNTNIN